MFQDKFKHRFKIINIPQREFNLDKKIVLEATSPGLERLHKIIDHAKIGDS
jgi:hypothetical protein